MIRDRIGDESRKGSLPADTATASVAYEYLAWATVWLLVGTVACLIPAIKLNWPDFLAISWLSYGLALARSARWEARIFSARCPACRCGARG